MTLKELLEKALAVNASDLHVGAGSPPQIRVDGNLKTLEGYPALTAEDTLRLCCEPISAEQREKIKTARELDFSFGIGERCRIRANIFWQQASMAGAFRQIPFRIPTIEELGLPDILIHLTERTRGLVLVTGPTGSGKSTTLAALLDRINEQRHDHIITIEDPIEYLYVQKNCVIAQREVGSDTDSFSLALKYALRQDPDVILVGEMRDLETIQNAVTAAETGHLVFATLHTNTAVQSIDRIIDVFPPHQQPQVRTQLSFILEAVVTQQLMPRNGGGRVLAQEIMVPNAAIRNLIRENKTHQIYASMQVGQDKSGMLTMNQALANLVSHQVIPFEEGVRRSTDRDEFMHLMEKFRTMGPAALGRAVQPGGAAAADDRMKTLGRQPAQKG
ncbi:MAG: type IV pilus twitching motility protein PilT [Deltaproteobacteria bacterium]|nr:type IV pilus twitching motility protein PilT [Deltaproteobacteria bacterium]